MKRVATPRGKVSLGGRCALGGVVFALVVLSVASARAQPEERFGVDLHSHVFMKHGLGAFYRGSFRDRVADSWDDRLSSKVDAATLDASGLRLVVVALFAHPVFRGDVREAIWEQVYAARRFVRDHPEWGIATTPGEARALLAAGRRVLVLSLEGASGVLECEADLDELVDEAGIAIVTAIHLVDDRYGGAAAMTGFKRFANPLGVVDRLLDPSGTDVGTNHRGLAPLGRRLVVELIRRGVWIDLTHASDRAAAELVEMVKAAGQPVLVTHTPLRADRPAERSVAPVTMAAVKATGGLVGLLPSEDAFAATRSPALACGAGCEDCRGGVPALARAWSDAAASIGRERVMLGTDFNGGMRHLAASCGEEGSLGSEAGMHHPGQLGELWAALRRRGAPVVPASVSVETFMRAWERVRPVALPAEGLPELPSSEAARGPSLAARLRVGAGIFDDRPVFHADGRVALRKDQGRAFPADPVIELLRLSGSIDVAPGSGEIAAASGAFAPLAIGAAWHDDQLDAEAFRIEIERAPALTLARRIQWTALRGRARTMPGILKAPGAHQLFVEIGADVLGYEGILFTDGRSLEGVHLVGGEAGLGFRGGLGGGADLALAALVRGDLTALVGVAGVGFAHQSDLAATGALDVGTAWCRFFVEGGVRAQRLVASPRSLDTIPVLTAGMSLRR